MDCSAFKKGSIVALAVVFTMCAAGYELNARPAPPRTFSIHGSSYRHLEGAEREVESLKARGLGAFYKKVKINGKGTWYRIYIGRYESFREADRKAQKLKQIRVIEGYSIDSMPSASVTPPSGEDRSVKEAAVLHKRSVPSSSVKAGAGKSATSGTQAAVDPPRPDSPKDMPSGATPDGKTDAGPPGQEPRGDGGKSRGEGPVMEPSGNPHYDQAVGLIREGRYEKAVEILKEMARQKIDDSRLQEWVWRRLADSYFSMGEKGDRKYLLAAVDQYKNMLRQYPDVRSGNDLFYHRLITLYEKLGFFYEGQTAAENLISKYPDSPHGQEALFKAAQMYMQTGKQDQAIQKYQSYLERYPQGKYARISIFRIGEGYFAADKMELAGRWFDEALKRWPGIEDLPPELLMSLGRYSHRAGRHADAVHQYSLYISLYGQDVSAESALYAMACSFLAMKELPQAMRLYSRVIEGYPESAEARESIIALANIGVARRKMKLQPSMAGWDAFVNPLDAYDDLLRKNPSEDLVERLLYLKGDALIKYGRYEESLDVNRYLLVRCPKGDYNADIKRNLKHAGKVLIHRYYERGDHAAVADMYFKTYAKALISMDDAQLMVKIRESLNRIGLTDDAAGISLLASGEKKAGRDISTLPEFPEGVKGKAGKEIVRVENILKLLEGNAAGDERIPQGLKALLGDLYYGKGMYEQAARNYDEVMWLGLDVDDPARTHLHYADTLRALNRCPEAEGHYRHAVDAINAEKPSSRPDVLADAYMGLGDCQYRQGRFEKGLANYEMAEKCASDRRRRSWSVYGVVRGLVNLAKEQELEKAFARLRAGSEEEFWPKVVAYLSADREWMEAYGEYVADGQAR